MNYLETEKSKAKKVRASNNNVITFNDPIGCGKIEWNNQKQEQKVHLVGKLLKNFC